MKYAPRLLKTLLLTLLGSSAAVAQATTNAPFGLEQGQAPVLQFAAQYQMTHANAPPSGCGCFWLQGGGGQVAFSVLPNWSVVADIMHASASNINGTDENLSVTNYVFGPRYTMWRDSRFSPYGQVLAGSSKVSSNYTIYAGGNSYFAAQAGFGVNFHLTPHYSIVPIEADYVWSRAVNNVNSSQNNLRLGAGLVYRLGPH